MTHAGTIVVYVLGPPLIALVGLMARLGWQARRDKRRQDTLRVLVSRLPDARLVEIHDVRDDGSHLHLRITGVGPDAQRENDE